MTLELKVNFRKNKFCGINVDNRFLHVAECFLRCRVAILPFKFLSLPIRANLRTKIAWDLVINVLKNIWLFIRVRRSHLVVELYC